MKQTPHNITYHLINHNLKLKESRKLRKISVFHLRPQCPFKYVPKSFLRTLTLSMKQ